MYVLTHTPWVVAMIVVWCLFQAKSGKELVAFLFNDFLLLTQPQKPMAGASSVFSLDTKTNSQFKMYRTVSIVNAYGLNNV